MRFATWTPSHLPAFVRFWNKSFAARRNFFPVTGALLRQRVMDKETNVEKFDPRGFILACEGKEVVGLIHVGRRPESLCRVLDPSWPGGAQGYVAFLYVDKERRRKGIGTELWHRGLQRLRDTKQVVLDGQCVNPFYGNSEGPFTPFWGTPEGVGVEWDDSGTKKFLARKGFPPRFRGIHLALQPVTEPPERPSLPGFRFHVLESAYPELGRPLGERRATAGGLDYEVVAAERQGTVAGLFCYYPLKEVRPGLFAIYEAAVVPELRGRALGRRLLEASVARMRTRGADQIEVLTLPELSPAAHKLYLGAGFQQVTSWAIY